MPTPLDGNLCFDPNRAKTKIAQDNWGWVLTFALVNLMIASGPVCLAADLDFTFGLGGRVTTDVSGSYDEARALAIEPDGQLVVAGVSGTGPSRDFALVRYNMDGSLDQTFGAGGKVNTDFSGGSDAAWALVIQKPDGKIVVAGESSGDFALARYEPDGTLDSQFGAGGRITIDLGRDDRANAVALQSDGKIVVAGVADGLDFALVRYGTDGALDVSFGTVGYVITDFSGSWDAASAVAIQPNGMIVAAGASGSFPRAKFALARYNADGSIDESFGVEGKVTIGFHNDSRAHTLALQPDGKIVVAGFVDNGSNRDAALARYNVDGTLDGSFGDAGKVLTDFGGRNFGSALAIRSDGRIVVAGFDDFLPYYDFALAQYEGDGRMDATFSTDGAVLTEFGGNSWINAVAVQSDGKIVAVGYARLSSGADVALVRYQGGR